MARSTLQHFQTDRIESVAKGSVVNYDRSPIFQASYFLNLTPSPEFSPAAKNSTPYSSSNTRCSNCKIFNRRGSIRALSSASILIMACRVTFAFDAKVSWSIPVRARAALINRGEGQIAGVW